MEGVFQELVYKCDHRDYLMHTHMGYQIIYLKKGKLLLTIGNEPLTAVAPCFIFFNNMEQHSITVCEGENERYLINLSAKTAQSIVRNKTLLMFFSSGKDSRRIIDVTNYNAEFDSIAKIMLSFYTAKPAFYAETVAHAFNLMLSMLHQLCPDLLRQDDSKIQIAVHSIKTMIERDPKIDAPLKELAADFHFNEYYLLHSFKQIIGYSIKEFQMMCRIALACELLLNSGKNITEICFDTGFNDVSNFSRYFKHKTGYSPSDYRKNFLERI